MSEKKMKIAILTEILSTHSGSRTSIELAKHLSPGNKITLLAYSFLAEKEVKKNLEKRGVKVVLVNVPKIPLGKWLAAFNFLSSLKGNEIISFHGSLPTFLIAKLAGIPLIKTYYGTQLHAYLERLLPDQKAFFKDRLLNWLGNQLIFLTQKIYFGLSDQVVAISQYTAKEAQKLYGRKIPFIYFGADSLKTHRELAEIPPARCKTPSRWPNGLLEGGETPTILSVSRFTPYKGFHLLIKAVRKTGWKVNLFLVGPAPLPKYLDYLKKIKTPQTRILVDISNQELAALYQNCDFYASCDRYLFLGLPPLEAALFGKPSLVLDRCAAREVVNHQKTGFVAQNLSEFSQYLKILIDSPRLRAKMGREAKLWVQKNFSWQKTAREYQKLFDQKKGRCQPRTPGRCTGLLMALVVSLLFGLPHLLIPWFLGGLDHYQPLAVNQVPMLTYEETLLYASQAHEVCDGHPFSLDVELAEYKNLWQASSVLPALLAGWISCSTGSVNHAFIIADFLLPPLIFLGVYSFLLKMTGSRLASLTGGVLLLTADALFLFLPPLTLKMAKAFGEILTINGQETVFLEFSRYPYPQFSFLLLIIHLYFLWSALKEKIFPHGLLAAISLGALFYTYFYSWTFVLAGEAVLMVIFFRQRDWTKLKRLLTILVIGLILSFFYWIFFFNFQHSPTTPDVLVRVGLELGRIRNLHRTAQYLLFALLFSLLIKKKDFNFWFLLAFLLGGLLCLNLQLFTGRTLQSWHWTTRALNPWSIIMLVYLLHHIKINKVQPSTRSLHPASGGKGKVEPFKKTIFTALILIFLLRAFILHAVVAKNTYQGYTLPKTTLEAFDWLNQNTPKDSVVLTPSFETIALIPSYTHNNVFLPHGIMSVAGNQEITHRLLATYKIFGLEREKLAEILAYAGDGLGDCQGEQCLVKSEFWEKQALIQLFHMKYFQKIETFSRWSTAYAMPEEEQEAILTAYDKFLEKPEILPENYRLDYLLLWPGREKNKGD